MNNSTSTGLEGIVVADTAISEVDGERGKLVIAGDDVERLAAHATYEQALTRVLAAGADGPVTTTGLGAARAAAWERLPRLGDALALPDAMDALRTALGHVTSHGAGAGMQPMRSRRSAPRP